VSDFRRELYESYATTAKSGAVPTDDAVLRSYFASCDVWFGPFLEGLDSDAPILELGCGPGHLLRFLQLRGFTRARGVDLCAAHVALATGRGLDVEVADVWAELSRHEGSLAAVLAIDVLEHFTREELLRLLPLIRAALAPGGRLIVQTPNGAGLFPNEVIHGDLTHMTVLSPGSLRQLLLHAGFEEVRFAETRPVPMSWKGWFRVLLWRLVRWGANTVRYIETGKRQEVWTENVIACCTRPLG
jgi:SAM-dependent methyltransferase